MKNLFRFLALLATTLLLLTAISGCGPKGNLPNIEIVQEMMESPAIKPQEKDKDRPGVGGMRVPPEGTVPMGAYMPYKYGDDFAGSAANKNPFEGQMAPEILSVGKWQFDTYCAVCHGPTGQGDGTVAKYMGNVPSVTSAALKNDWKDGQLFHLITRGRGRMGGYASQIPNVKERWSLVNYIRSLQRGN